ncbi:DNA polymerase III subunit chi [Rickettsiales bacterium LUAb2]
MLDINFYGVSSITKEKALIKLLEKTIETNKKAIVFSNSLDKLQALDDTLWTSANWLPHALISDEFKEKQLILLTDKLESLPNKPNYLFVIDDSEVVFLDSFERLFIIFYNQDDNEINFAKEKWKFYKKAGYNLKYFQQNREGKFDNVSM